MEIFKLNLNIIACGCERSGNAMIPKGFTLVLTSERLRVSCATFVTRVEEIRVRISLRRILQIPGEDGRSKWWFRRGDVLMRFHAGFA